jgi:hypothetical protein
MNPMDQFVVHYHQPWWCFVKWNTLSLLDDNGKVIYARILYSSRTPQKDGHHE